MRNDLSRIALAAFAPVVWGSTYVVTTELLPALERRHEVLLHAEQRCLLVLFERARDEIEQRMAVWLAGVVVALGGVGPRLAQAALAVHSPDTLVSRPPRPACG